MRPITATVGPLAAASANNIALSQTPGAAGPLTLNGATVINGIAILDTARRVLITTADTTHTFTVTGTGPTGSLLTEVVGPITGSAYTAQDFKTVTSVVINAGATAAVTVGTNGIASSPWVRFDEYAAGSATVGTDISGTVNYTVQQSMDDPNSPTNPVLPANMTWLNCLDATLVGASTAIFSVAYPLVPIFARVVLNSGAGSVTATFMQTGAAPY